MSLNLFSDTIPLLVFIHSLGAHLQNIDSTFIHFWTFFLHQPTFLINEVFIIHLSLLLILNDFKFGQSFFELLIDQCDQEVEQDDCH